MAGKRPVRTQKPSHTALIQTSKLVKRLERHSFTHPKLRDFEKDYLQPSQVTAAIALLKKTMPDLAAQQITADVDGKIEISWEK